jgi:DNA recombination protein RmuC
MSSLTIIIGLNALAAGLSLVLAGFALFGRGRAGDLSTDLRGLREDGERQSSALRQEVMATINAFSTGLDQRFVALSEALVGQQAQGRVELGSALALMRDTIARNLEDLRKENDAKIEQMRATVEEKLQGTLEARLGESFKMVSERLEKVHQGLGEMQVLATGVGDLKRVLTNVKARGGWAEVQLGSLLEDMLTPDQYARNVAIPRGSPNFVEYAVKLPGQEAGDHCLVPIDAKFPNEDYERLTAAQESGNPQEVEAAGAALERAIRAEAQRIQKYIQPPETTNFAIMYLPTEGLFAEVIRRPGLSSELQTKWRVNVTGPTTLSAVLSSLQMGFTTLTIQRRSSEVWQVLGAAKTEFQKYSEVWDRLGKQLDTARRTVEEAGKRTKAVQRRLRDVAAPESAPQLVALQGGLGAALADDDGEAA